MNFLPPAFIIILGLCRICDKFLPNLLRESIYEMLTEFNMQFIFAYEMGDLIFCELDITSSHSPAKRMYV